jgi:hypothetical protein
MITRPNLKRPSMISIGDNSPSPAEVAGTRLDAYLPDYRLKPVM